MRTALQNKPGARRVRKETGPEPNPFLRPEGAGVFSATRVANKHIASHFSYLVSKRDHSELHTTIESFEFRADSKCHKQEQQKM